MNKPQTPEPNEVMDAEEILARFKVGADDYFSKDIRYGRTADETVEAIHALVAQQNAALLRKLRNREILIDGVWAVPSYILEAKLKAIEEAYGK